MKKIIVFCIVLLVTLNTTAQPKSKTPAKSSSIKMKSLIDSFSYALGFNIAGNIKAQGIAADVNMGLMQKGFNDVFKNKSTLLTTETATSILQKQMAIYAKAKAIKDKAPGITFLETNKKGKGVIVLPDGLQYEVIKSGDSSTNKPKLADTVVVNYIGTLTDGKEFDNSYKRGQPAVFPVNRVIKGWTEILQLMPVGAHWKVYIPSDLAYGQNPPPGSGIIPGAVLIFEITLEGIKPAAEASKVNN